jgi:hypothetical protein
MASLYEINQQILECVDMDTGEVIDTVRLDQLNMQWDQKIESMVLWYKNLCSDAEAYKQEKRSFEEKEKAARSKAESIKTYIETALQGQKFKTTKASVSYRKSEQVEVFDINVLDDDYLKYAEPEINKSKIKESIKFGIPVQGAKLVEKNNIQIK